MKTLGVISPNSKKRRIARCETCDMLFLYLPSQNTGRYCSRGCLDLWRKSEGVIDRFWDRVRILSEDECWLFRDAKHYGQFTVDYENIGAHVFSMELVLGRKLKPGEWVLHKCDNPPCVNPKHLFVGDAKDNSEDMLTKGRHRTEVGEEHHNAIYDEDVVVWIRRLYKTGKYSLADLANRFGGTPAAIAKIVRRET